MPASLDRPRRTLRVLIVEDEPRLRDLLLDVVPDLGYTATAARTAEEALRAMEAEPADIVILDLHLPLMGGMELFERLRHGHSATQVIVLTAYGDLATAQRAIRLDVVEFLSKPCHLRDLDVALDRAARRAGAAVAGERGGHPLVLPSSRPAPPEAELTIAEAEYRQIIAALRRHNGNRTVAAAELGISRRTLHYKLAEYRRTGRSVE